MAAISTGARSKGNSGDQKDPVQEKDPITKLHDDNITIVDEALLEIQELLKQSSAKNGQVIIDWAEENSSVHNSTEKKPAQ